MTLPLTAGVIGWPVAHSKSPAIHRFWLAKLGLDGDYGRFPVAPGRLGEAIRALPALGLRGVNVTVPHKQAVIAHLDRLDPLAKRIGAVNTVVVEEGLLVGYNTDAAGFMEPLGPSLGDEERFRHAVVLGAGGAARAVIAALDEADFAIIVSARDQARGKALVADWPMAFQRITPLAHFAEPAGEPAAARSNTLALVVNTTSLGMTGQPPLAFDFSHVPPDSIVYDIVYQPLETPLLAAARARGMRTIDGLAMLIGQAAAAFALFFGVPAPREHDAELRALLIA